MNFKLFLPLASTLVVGGTTTVFYMGYLKNKEIREKRPDVNIPKLEESKKQGEENTEEKSVSSEKFPKRQISSLFLNQNLYPFHNLF